MMANKANKASYFIWETNMAMGSWDGYPLKTDGFILVSHGFPKKTIIFYGTFCGTTIAWRTPSGNTPRRSQAMASLQSSLQFTAE